MGYPSCRGKEDTPRILCGYGDEVPVIPAESPCEACGRLIPYRFITVVCHASMKPDDMK